MRRALLVFGAVLVALFVLFSIWDTSDYAVEKRLWRLQKQFDKIARDPQAVPDQKFESVAEEYRNIIRRFSSAKIAPRIYLQLGNLYGLKKDYNQSRDSFNEILRRFPGDGDLCAEALMNIAKTYEVEDKDDQAIDTYQWIWAHYPLTDIGLSIPLYLANYYRRLGQDDKAEGALARAVSFYKETAREQPNSRLEFNALRLLATAHLSLKDWNAAVRVLGDVLLRYPSAEYLNSRRAIVLVKSINTISIAQMKDYDLPIGIFDKFVRQNPGHALNAYLRQVITALEDMKAKVHSGE